MELDCPSSNPNSSIHQLLTVGSLLNQYLLLSSLPQFPCLHNGNKSWSQDCYEWVQVGKCLEQHQFPYTSSADISYGFWWIYKEHWDYFYSLAMKTGEKMRSLSDRGQRLEFFIPRKGKMNVLYAEGKHSGSQRVTGRRCRKGGMNWWNNSTEKMRENGT